MKTTSSVLLFAALFVAGLVPARAGVIYSFQDSDGTAWSFEVPSLLTQTTSISDALGVSLGYPTASGFQSDLIVEGNPSTAITIGWGGLPGQYTVVSATIMNPLDSNGVLPGTAEVGIAFADLSETLCGYIPGYGPAPCGSGEGINFSSVSPFDHFGTYVSGYLTDGAISAELDRKSVV